MRNLVQLPPSTHCERCGGELLFFKQIETDDPVFDTEVEIFVCSKCGHVHSRPVIHDPYAAHTVPPKLAAQTMRSVWAGSSEPVGVEAMKNRLHAIFTEDGKTNIIVSMYKRGARYKDIASETGLSIPSVRYRLVELSYKGLVDFQPRYRSHTKRRR